MLLCYFDPAGLCGLLPDSRSLLVIDGSKTPMMLYHYGERRFLTTWSYQSEKGMLLIINYVNPSNDRGSIFRRFVLGHKCGMFVLG